MARSRWGRKTLLVTVFAVAMGHLEGVVVYYLRRIVLPNPVVIDQHTITKSFPLLIEQSREAATIIMLVTLALVAAAAWRERAGVFLLAFGVWDISYYVSLYILLRWPPSLHTMDVLFLIPVVWRAPVIVPIAVSAGMIVAGLWLLLRASGSTR